MLSPWKKGYDQPRQHTKKQRHYFANKGPSIQSNGFPNSHIWTWELDYKENWALKNWCFWTVVLKTLESPWTARRFNQSILKEMSPEYSSEGLVLTLKLQYFSHLMRRTKSMQKKDPDAGQVWRQGERVTAEDKMVGWHHQLNGQEFE